MNKFDRLYNMIKEQISEEMFFTDQTWIEYKGNIWNQLREVNFGLPEAITKNFNFELIEDKVNPIKQHIKVIIRCTPINQQGYKDFDKLIESIKVTVDTNVIKSVFSDNIKCTFYVKDIKISVTDKVIDFIVTNYQ